MARDHSSRRLGAEEAAGIMRIGSHPAACTTRVREVAGVEVEAAGHTGEQTHRGRVPMTAPRTTPGAVAVAAVAGRLGSLADREWAGFPVTQGHVEATHAGRGVLEA